MTNEEVLKPEVNEEVTKAELSEEELENVSGGAFILADTKTSAAEAAAAALARGK